MQRYFNLKTLRQMPTTVCKQYMYVTVMYLNVPSSIISLWPLGDTVSKCFQDEPGLSMQCMRITSALLRCKGCVVKIISLESDGLDPAAIGGLWKLPEAANHDEHMAAAWLMAFSGSVPAPLAPFMCWLSPTHQRIYLPTTVVATLWAAQ